MIWGIHYFITKLKTKIDVIPRGCFNTTYPNISWHVDGIQQIPFVRKARHSDEASIVGSGPGLTRWRQKSGWIDRGIPRAREFDESLSNKHRHANEWNASSGENTPAPVISIL